MQLKKTKIVCTIGPASWDYLTLKKLALEGMNIARLNMSHGSYEEKSEQIKLIRQISKELNKPIGIIADLQGPKIRLGEIEGERDIRTGETVRLSMFALNEELPMQFDLTPFVHKNHRIFLNDGLVQLRITSINGKVITTKALNSGVVSSHKGVNIPDTNLKGASFTQKDREDAEFALDQDVDYIALSFVQSVNDLSKLKEMIKKAKSKTQLIVKVEKREAIENLESIVKATDAIMIARGDLAIETSPSEVPIYQQKMVKLCRQYQKPVIVATQMLESMTENPRPTRAEASDVANAVLDQSDAVMLSAESASGKYPVEAVRTMKEIILDVEQHPDYSNYIKIDWTTLAADSIALNSVVSSAASMAYRTGAKAIVVATTTGKTARLLSSFRPNAQIIAVTHDAAIQTQLALVWGIYSIIVKPSENFETFLKNMTTQIEELGLAKKGDNIVFVIGSKIGIAGTTDTVKIAKL